VSILFVLNAFLRSVLQQEVEQNQPEQSNPLTFLKENPEKR